MHGNSTEHHAGPTKRTRSPEMVVREMEHLYRDKGCSVFLFHDDDFPVKVRGDNDWIRSFCNELVKSENCMIK